MEESAAPSTTWCVTLPGCRWPSRSPAPTGTTACSSSRCSTRCPRCSTGAAARGDAPTSCTPIRATTTGGSAPTCAGAASPARIARRGVEPADRLGRHRWVVERTASWLLHHRRLALRYDHTATTVTALAILACTLICARRLPDPCVLQRRLSRHPDDGGGAAAPPAAWRATRSASPHGPRCSPRRPERGPARGSTRREDWTSNAP